MFGLLKSKPLLEQDATHWLFDTFAWALRNFDARVFFAETTLVTPSNRHFPGRESSAQGMAQLIFDRVKQYAGLQHWPCELVKAEDPRLNTPVALAIEGQARGSKAVATAAAASPSLIIPYDSHQLAKPEAMIAQYAHILAHYLGQTADEPPPGGATFWPQATELLAVFLGFGIMVANSAYTFRGGCGSCYNPLAERTAYLSQDEAVYALAIFSVLKDISNKEVLPHLKNYLRPVFKNAVKEIRNKPAELQTLTALHAPDGAAASLSAS